MKNTKFKNKTLTALAALALGGTSLCLAQTADLTITSFDSGAQGSQPSGSGAWYGSYTAGWDGTVDNTGNAGGALYIQSRFSNSSDTPLTEYVCLPGNNLWWSGAGTFNVSLYKSLEFDLKWDNSSTLTIPEFNNPATVPTSFLQGWAPYGYLAGSVGGLEIDFCWKGDGSTTYFVNTNIPTAASNGWVHFKIPINQSQANIDPSVGIIFKKWLNQNWGIATDATANFWVDNIKLEGTAGPPPPPTIMPPTKAAQGLNVFASTTGNSYYDRQEAELRQTTGLSWVGQATGANPVTYSFTINNYPNSVNCEAFLFLVPNPAANENAPDWNETNCAIAYIQGSSTEAILRFRYKVDEDHQQAMYSAGNEGRGYYTNAPGSWDGITPGYLESGDLGSVTNNGVLGTWKVKFTSDTNITLIAPNGNTSSFTMPPYNAAKFAEVSGFNVYLGMQANNANAMNKAVVYSDFAITGNVTPFSENFLTDTVLDTTNIWNTSISGGPKGVLIVPAGSAYWLQWTLPDGGFALQTSSNLLNAAATAWNSIATYTPIGMSGLRQQLITANELPGSSQAFFGLIKREFTQLQVLLPGESNAPNTLTGKTGTASHVSLANDNGLVTVTINAVDATFHIVSSTDNVTLGTTDTGAQVPAGGALVNGTLQQTLQFQTQSPPNWTVTATNTSNLNIAPATSSPLTVDP